MGLLLKYKNGTFNKMGLYLNEVLKWDFFLIKY
jgi:hypothetical protein